MINSKIKVLDGLRGYATLMVYVAHFPQITNHRLGQFIYHVVVSLKLGYLGVDIFFVLSGFLLTRIMLKEKADYNFSFVRFYLKRAIRIFPVYYLTLLLISIFFTWDKIIYTSTFTFNYFYPFETKRYPFEHFWSLCVEEHFYLLLPLIVIYFTKYVSKSILTYLIPIISILLSLLTYHFFSAKIADDLVFSSSYSRMITLSFGAALAYNEKEFEKVNFDYRYFAISISLLLCLFLIGINGQNIHIFIPSAVIKLIVFALFSLLLLIVILKLEMQSNRFQIVFSNRFISFIGMISYGLYMYHYPMFVLVTEKYKNYVGVISKTDALTLMIAPFLVTIISFYIFENTIKNKFIILYKHSNI